MNPAPSPFHGPLGPHRDSRVGWAFVAALIGFIAALLFVFIGGSLLMPKPTPEPSPSPRPTFTRQPTQIPTALPTLTPMPVTAVVMEPTVNVRANPSLSAKVISKIHQGDQIALLAKTGIAINHTQWFEIRVGEQTGWVYGDTLQMLTGDSATLPER